jgi:hypothetical protein
VNANSLQFLFDPWNDIAVKMFVSAGMKDIVLWMMLAIPASGILSVGILLRDEVRARGRDHRIPR